MSFLTRFSPLTARVAPIVRSTTTPSIAVGGARFLSSTGRRDKGPLDATKDTLRKADRTVSDAAVKGIEKGQKATGTIKEAAGQASETAGSQSEMLKEEAEGVASKGKGKAQEAAGEAKGKASEVAGEAKGKAGEVKGKAKEAASNLNS